ncbi:MAG: hypothetical protein H6813_03460 [Phycisphaeraceae bacterium]|nr:hypothetical protein [Phycisphaeraceae bacterium]MCB9847004.1 hypothetical protein [Phycisphaeraceae bacterium]
MRKKTLQRASVVGGMVIALAALAVVCGGCESAPKASSGAGGRGAATPFDAGAADSASSGWTIVLATFNGPTARQDAEAALPRVQSGSGFGGLFVEHRKRGSIIASGRYASEGDPRAAADLARFRSFERNGVRPFGQAFLAPPVGGAVGSRPEINLSQARSVFGGDARFTLQVAVYESADRREAMRAAEEAAYIYRQDGELAFYYHGPTKSMVTIGVFGDSDIDLDAGLESPELTSLRERHPLNLFNGMAIRETIKGRPREQPSQLVQIP